MLGIPRGIQPVALIAAGYPLESREPTPRRELAEIAFAERWGGKIAEAPSSSDSQ